MLDVCFDPSLGGMLLMERFNPQLGLPGRDVVTLELYLDVGDLTDGVFSEKTLEIIHRKGSFSSSRGLASLSEGGVKIGIINPILTEGVCESQNPLSHKTVHRTILCQLPQRGSQGGFAA